MHARIFTQQGHARLVITNSENKTAALDAIVAHGGGGIGHHAANGTEWTIFYLLSGNPPCTESLADALRATTFDVDVIAMEDVHH